MKAGYIAISDRNHWLRRCKWALDQTLITACHRRVKDTQLMLMLALFSEKVYELKCYLALIFTKSCLSSLQEWMTRQPSPDTSVLPLSDRLFSRQSTLIETLPKTTSPSRTETSSARDMTESTDSISPQPSRSIICTRPSEEAPTVGRGSSNVFLTNPKKNAKRSSLQRKMVAADVQEIRKPRVQRTTQLEISRLSQGKPNYALSLMILQALEQGLGHANDEMKSNTADVKTWVRLGTWWLLKVWHT